ncbi:MAG: hypothetical protein KGI00_02590 [Candidatus Micrarchaeota archaeon]|nr:hypothetical protein [Candidatus Micrarchaeota archaeon]MDE1849595.1 hypothetical protein [Candidatus Micrarchaeota archaeon]
MKKGISKGHKRLIEQNKFMTKQDENALLGLIALGLFGGIIGGGTGALVGGAIGFVIGLSLNRRR